MKRLVLFVLACGGSPAPTPTPTGGPPASPIATRATADDVEVAHVNGRPVWGSCVAAQAARGESRDQALRECVDFELLSQIAEQRGLARDGDVAAETRTALVGQFVAHEFEDKLTRPTDFGDLWTKLVEKNRWRFDHPEVRGSAYVRLQDEMLAKELYAKLSAERGLVASQLQDLAKQIIGTRGKVEFATVPPYEFMSRLDETYATALFKIPEVGRVSPPTHTRWGWDVILFDSLIPETHPKPDELVRTMMPDVKRTYFPLWVNRIAQGSGVKIQVFDQNVQLLENL